MGLDMNMTGRKFLPYSAAKRFEEGFEIEAIEVKIAYWRKHPNLHGFIVETFAGGNDNCQDIELDISQLQTIIEAVKANALPKTEGFFFGVSNGDEAELQDDLEQLGKAVSWLTPLHKQEEQAWYSVIYRASW